MISKKFVTVRKESRIETERGSRPNAEHLQCIHYTARAVTLRKVPDDLTSFPILCFSRANSTQHPSTQESLDQDSPHQTPSDGRLMDQQHLIGRDISQHLYHAGRPVDLDLLDDRRLTQAEKQTWIV